MTGKIDILATSEDPGRITSDMGTGSLHYAYQKALSGADGLSLGCLVSFETQKGSPDIAVDVCSIEKRRPSSGGPKSRREVRYEGFGQENNIRTYRFSTWRSGEEHVDANVIVDMNLFREFEIGIQEGPALCMRFVEAELEDTASAAPTAWNRVLSGEEMQSHRERTTSKKRR